MLYRNILAAVNEHLNSEVAARYAVGLARACGARLLLCFIADKALQRRDFDAAEAAMRRLFLGAEEAGVPVESITESGDPVAEISRIVRQEKIGLVLAATRREDAEKRFYAGTLTRRLSLKLPCSVALVRVVHMGRGIRPGKILVPLKARIDHLRERASFTARLAEAFGAGIALFHAPQPLTRFFHGEIDLTGGEWLERLPADVLRFMSALEKDGIDHEEIIVPRSAGRAITIEAAAKRHDLIVMGASERSLFSRLVKGNPVEDVLRETPCDLIILKPRHED